MSASISTDGASAVSMSPIRAWSRRVRRVGGLIQLGFATFWLVRGGLAIPGPAGRIVAGCLTAVAIAVLIYAQRTTTGSAPRPTGAAAKKLELSITIATILQLVASFVAPALVIAAGHSNWVLPSIAVTIGPLLLWLDRQVDMPRYRVVGSILIIGPPMLAVVLSGAGLTAATGIGAGLLLLGSAFAGFRDLAQSPLEDRNSPS